MLVTCYHAYWSYCNNYYGQNILHAYGGMHSSQTSSRSHWKITDE